MVASRIAGGPGGIEKGSMAGVVKAIQRRKSTGIILANMGESYWSPEHKRAITVVDSRALSMPSLVHMGVQYHPQVNDIPGSESPLCHARTVLNTIVAKNANKNAKINIIAAGDSCEVIASLLDEEKTWAEWGPSLQGALFFCPAFYLDTKQAGLKDFLAKVRITRWTDMVHFTNITRTRNQEAIQLRRNLSAHLCPVRRATPQNGYRRLASLATLLESKVSTSFVSLAHWSMDCLTLTRWQTYRITKTRPSPLSNVQRPRRR